MYGKIKTERLFFIRLNQTKLRFEKYVHLRDTVASDGNKDLNALEKMVNLPATFIGSSRHMHKYARCNDIRSGV